jgi:octaprenyl-diphosphate synthase
MSTLQNIKNPVKKELIEFEKLFNQTMKSNIPLLRLILNYLLRHKGKQVRPLLVLLSSKLCGDITPSTYTAATMVELLHTATLVHDDVVDESYERRGVFSIKALWRSKVAVLVGDYLLSKGLLVALKNKEFQLLEIISEAVKDMSEGELIQIKNKNNAPEIDNYFEVITKKTASFFAACTSCGAAASSKSTETIEKLYRFGLNLGIVFQLRDDLLDFEQKNLSGKPAGNDWQEKKITLPLLYALSKAEKSIKNKILKDIKNGTNKKSHQDIIAFVQTNNGITYTYEQMNIYKDKALHELTSFPDNEIKQSLIELLNYIINRKK